MNDGGHCDYWLSLNGWARYDFLGNDGGRYGFLGQPDGGRYDAESSTAVTSGGDDAAETAGADAEEDYGGNDFRPVLGSFVMMVLCLSPDPMLYPNCHYSVNYYRSRCHYSARRMFRTAAFPGCHRRHRHVCLS